MQMFVNIRSSQHGLQECLEKFTAKGWKVLSVTKGSELTRLCFSHMTVGRTTLTKLFTLFVCSKTACTGLRSPQCKTAIFVQRQGKAPLVSRLMYIDVHDDEPKGL